MSLEPGNKPNHLWYHPDLIRGAGYEPPFRKPDLSLVRNTFAGIYSLQELWKTQGYPLDPSAPPNVSLKNKIITMRQMLRDRNVPDSEIAELIKYGLIKSQAKQMGKKNEWGLDVSVLMELMNVAPEFGVYQKNNRVGPSAQSEQRMFTTPLETNPQMHAQALVARAHETLENLRSQGIVFNQNNPFSFLFIGDGTGTMRRSVAETLQKNHPELARISKFVVVDIGEAMLIAQKKGSQSQIPEDFYHHTIWNMRSLKDNSLNGIVWIYEVLDDLAGNAIIKDKNGAFYTSAFMWDNDLFVGAPKDTFRLGASQIEKNIFNLCGYEYLSHHKYPIPVSPQIPMALNEVNRILNGGSVVIGDYSGHYVAPRDSLSNSDVIRIFRDSSLSESGEEINIVSHMGRLNFTLDVDPLLVTLSAQENGWIPKMMGVFGHFLGTYGTGLKAESLLQENAIVHDRLRSFHMRQDFQSEYLKYKSVQLNDQSLPAWVKEYEYFLNKSRELDAFNNTIWIMDYDIVPKMTLAG